MRTLELTAPPSLAKLAVVGAIGISLGLVCVWATIGEPPPGSVAAEGGEGLVGTADEGEVGNADEGEVGNANEGEDADENADVDEGGNADEGENAEEDVDEPALAELAPHTAVVEAGSDFRFQRGRLAYLRCVGLEGAGGRCPRDTTLEDTVWSILESVGSCPGVVAGSADVRLHMGAGVTELRFRDFGDRPLDAGVLSACLDARVAGLRTDLRSADLVVSFRFEIRR